MWYLDTHPKGADKGVRGLAKFLRFILAISYFEGRISTYTHLTTSQPPYSYKLVYTPVPTWHQDTHMVPGYPHDTRIPTWYQDTHMVPGYPHGTRIPMWYQCTHVVSGYPHDTWILMWYQDNHVRYTVPHLASSILPLSSTVVYHVIQQVR